jgi:hypothetical protein
VETAGSSAKTVSAARSTETARASPGGGGEKEVRVRSIDPENPESRP